MVKAYSNHGLLVLNSLLFIRFSPYSISAWCWILYRNQSFDLQSIKLICGANQMAGFYMKSNTAEIR